MAEHVADEFSLEQLATRAGLSKFHFSATVQARDWPITIAAPD